LKRGESFGGDFDDGGEGLSRGRGGTITLDASVAAWVLSARDGGDAAVESDGVRLPKALANTVNVGRGRRRCCYYCRFLLLRRRDRECHVSIASLSSVAERGGVTDAAKLLLAVGGCGSTEGDDVAGTSRHRSELGVIVRHPTDLSVVGELRVRVKEATDEEGRERLKKETEGSCSNVKRETR
jgi:hypothetical protein